MQALAELGSFTTTVSATLRIALKIILVTHRSHRHFRYTRIIEILIQSAAIVSILLLGLGILKLIDFMHPLGLSTTGGRVFYQVYNYLRFTQPPITVSKL